MKVICISQARLGSTRLPQKVLKEINGIALIDYHFERLKHSKLVSQHWLSTSNLDQDDKLAHHAEKNAWPCFRGSEDNVLERFYHTAKAAGCQSNDMIVRLTGDCPLICPRVLDQTIEAHLNTNSNGYTHFVKETLPRGFDVEIFSMSNLERAYLFATTEAEREHVTLYMYTHPRSIDVLSLKLGQVGWGNYRLCVDEPADFETVKALVNLINKNQKDWATISAYELCELLDQHPEIASINKEVIQKTTH